MIRLYKVLKSSRAAIDLASIMVGVIIIGLIGGVVAASVFVVIPWSQDNAAKQQLDSIRTAENAIYGLSSDSNNQLKGNVGKSNYANSADLAANDILQTGSMHCAVTTNNSKGYAAYVKSGSGKVFTITSESQKATVVSDTTTIPTDCNFLASSDGATKPVDNITRFTINCGYSMQITLPMSGVVNGTVKWNDGVTQTFVNATNVGGRSVVANKTYTFEFTGTFTKLDSSKLSTENSKCIRSMDAWGEDSGTISANHGLYWLINLTGVPDHIPSTVTDTAYMMSYTVILEDSANNLSHWDVSNVTNMSNMFSFSYKMNADISGWNTSNVTTMDFMFNNGYALNRDLSAWDVKKVTNRTGFNSNGHLPLEYFPRFNKGV